MSGSSGDTSDIALYLCLSAEKQLAGRFRRDICLSQALAGAVAAVIQWLRALPHQPASQLGHAAVDSNFPSGPGVGISSAFDTPFTSGKTTLESVPASPIPLVDQVGERLAGFYMKKLLC